MNDVVAAVEAKLLQAKGFDLAVIERGVGGLLNRDKIGRAHV